MFQKNPWRMFCKGQRIWIPGSALGPPGMTRLPRRQHHRPALAETDARISGLGAEAAEDDLVAVLDETALLAGRHGQRLAAARCEFEKAAQLSFSGPDTVPEPSRSPTTRLQ